MEQQAKYGSYSTSSPAAFEHEMVITIDEEYALSAFDFLQGQFDCYIRLSRIGDGKARISTLFEQPLDFHELATNFTNAVAAVSKTAWHFTEETENFFAILEGSII